MSVALIHSSPVRIGAGSTYDIHYIARRMGQGHASQNWQVAYLTKLIAARGFPAPLPVMHGDEIVDRILPRKSRWLREPVDAWFDGQIPPEALPAIDAAEAAEADALIGIFLLLFITMAARTIAAVIAGRS
jgi:hypothetical protein